MRGTARHFYQAGPKWVGSTSSPDADDDVKG